MFVIYKKCKRINAQIMLSKHHILYKDIFFLNFSGDKRSKMVDQQLPHKEKFALENRQESVLTLIHLNPTFWRQISLTQLVTTWDSVMIIWEVRL